MRFIDTSIEQAAAYRDFVERQHPVWLRDLAWLMRDSEEIESIDTSINSMIPMWAWFRRFARLGFPGIPVGARPSYAIFLESPPAADDRIAAAGELLSHYVLERYRGVYPDASFEAYESNPKMGIEDRHHRTGLRLDQKVFVDHTFLGVTFLNLFLSGSQQEDDALYLSVTSRRHAGRLPAGPSFLTPLLDEEPRPWDDPTRRPPRASEVGETPSVSVTEPERHRPILGETELIFAAIGTDVEDFDRARPLDESAVAATLTELGFTVSEATLKISENQLEHPAAAILIETFSYQRRLRALHFELHGSAHDNLAVVRAFTLLGHRIRARLGSEDDWTNNR